jgi:hypothetical protein
MLASTSSIQGRWLVVSTFLFIQKGVAYLVFLETVFKHVLNNKTTSLTQCNLMPHAAKGFIDILHDLGRRLGPTEFEELLPDMAGITVNDCLRNSTEEFMNHNSLVVLRDAVERFLNHMTAESIHGQIQGIATNRLCNFDYLFRGAIFETPLNEEVAKAIDHQWISLGNNGLYNVILLLRSTDLQLLLEEYGCLLIVVAHNFIHDILPVAVNCTVKEATIVQWLGSG